VTAVVETARENQSNFLSSVEMSEIGEDWIAKSSHVQRKGRAGRTGPGMCFTLMTEEQYGSLKEFPEPPIVRSELTEVYLRLKSQGTDPRSLDLLDQPTEDQWQQAERGLRWLGLVDGTNTVTDLGRLSLSCPLGLKAARVIVAAADLGCSEEAAIVCCMLQAQGIGSVITDDSKRVNFVRYSGDHETVLRVYQEWVENDKNDWCEANGVSSAILKAADASLRKVHKFMSSKGIPISRMDPTDTSSENILRAFCAGYFNNTAKPNSSEPKQGLTLTRDYETNPTAVNVFRNSIFWTEGTQLPEGQVAIYGSISKGKKSKKQYL
jgi:HrpA-like RNA helicase